MIIKMYLLFFMIYCSGCSLFSQKGEWGRKSLWPLKRMTISEAFRKNISSPHVWVPTAGAGIIYMGGFDKKISNWAYDENIFFDDHRDSGEWSDILADALLYEMYLTPMLTASSKDDDTFFDYAASKAKGYLVVALSSRSADIAHDNLVSKFKRDRPDHSDHRSFPSGHSTQAGTRNFIVSKNLDSIPMNDHLRFGIKTANTATASLLLFSRVESRAHYPTDVLMGYALGAFLSGFIYDSLMNMDSDHPETVSITPLHDQWTMNYTYGF
jgi:hypothetical protein